MEERDTSEHEIEIEEFSSADSQDSKIPSENKSDGSHVRDKSSEEEASLVISIEKMMDQLPALSAECCIYRVPNRLRDLNPKAYTPQVVSIGPFHRGNQRLQVMEKQKLRYLKALLHRADCVISLGSYVKLIKEWEENIRNYYAETIEMSSSEFVKMILLDTAFIIEAMLRYVYDQEQEQIEHHLLFDIKRDMILLENQIPFFVLEHLFNLAISNSFLEVSIFFLGNMFLVDDIEKSRSNLLQVPEGSQPQQPPDSSCGVKHFVDLLRMFHLPSSLRSPSHTDVNFVRISNATELQEAGMRFRRGTSNHLLDIRYNNKVLEIPFFRMVDWTESVLRNMIAMEQCHYQNDTYITDYVIFMDSLIDTGKDAGLLIQNGIIENALGDSSAVSSIFNNLTDELLLEYGKYYYYDISEDLNKYCKERWHKWNAALRRNYCSSPWIIASTVAAIYLL